MKKGLILLLIGISFTLLKAQQITFCPPGAEWHYLFSQYYPNYGSKNETVKYTGNVIEGIDTLKLLTHTKFFTRMNIPQTFTTHIKQKGDTVFMRNEKTNNQWQILYNFAAQTSHSWTNTFNIGPNYIITYTTQVTAVGFKQVGNKNLRELSVSYTNSYGSSYSHSGLITEHFGSNIFLFNYISRKTSDGDYYLEFLCYTDSIIGANHYSDKPCNFSDLTGVINLDNAENNLAIFPNPINDRLSLKLNAEVGDFHLFLFNSLGQRVYHSERVFGDQEIDLSFLARGIYYLKVQNQTQQKTFKIIKEN